MWTEGVWMGAPGGSGGGAISVRARGGGRTVDVELGDLGEHLAEEGEGLPNPTPRPKDGHLVRLRASIATLSLHPS